MIEVPKSKAQQPNQPYFRRSEPVAGELTYRATNATTGVEYTDFIISTYDDRPTTGNVFVQFRQVSAQPARVAVGKFTIESFRELVGDLQTVLAAIDADTDEAADDAADAVDTEIAAGLNL